MTDVIQTEDLTKHYGEVHAAEAVHLQIKQGEIYGFLGLNGAWKMNWPSATPKRSLLYSHPTDFLR